jgi:hypothetical protein
MTLLVYGNVPRGLKIEDLNVQVPYKTAVQFTQSQWHGSHDLKMAIETSKVRVLTGPPNIGPAGFHPTHNTEMEQLKQENAVLRKDNEELRQEVLELSRKLARDREADLQRIGGQTGQLEAIQGLLQELRDRPAVINNTVLPGGAQAASAAPEDPEAVYIPDDFQTESDESSVTVKESKGADTSASVSQLKKLRGSGKK